jgi:hypothetical protein
VPLAVSRPASRGAHRGPVPLHRILCCCVLSLTPAPCAAALYFTLATPAPSLSAATLHTLLLRPLYDSFASATSRYALSLTPAPVQVPLCASRGASHAQCATPIEASANPTLPLTALPCAPSATAARPVGLPSVRAAHCVLLLGIVCAGFGHDFFYFVGGARELGG